MIRCTEIAFSCYAVTDMVRSRAFYEGILGLKATMVVGEPGGMQWTEYDLGASTLSLGVAPGWNPSSDGAVVALEVEDFDAAIAHLKAQQVRFKMEPFPTPVCQKAFILDPDNNTVCIHQRHAH
ncbi:MAG: VOC family protein [Verrucomicrobia bacterium]|nr:VOC family protein [Verrucomicrobiota bacterium]